MSRHIRWYGRPRQESFPGPLVETEGNPGSAVDLYRVSALQRIREDENYCYTDAATCAALARVIEGEIMSVADLEGAELALRILYFHDRVDVLLPGFRYKGTQVEGYWRSADPRTQLGYQLFSDCRGWDEIYAAEELQVSDGLVVGSSDPECKVLGRSILEVPFSYARQMPALSAAISSIPAHLGVAAYFSDGTFTTYAENRGYSGRFYSQFRDDWDKAVGAVPQIEMTLSLPPLLGITLDRASSRENIPGAIAELRQELAASRQELSGFESVLRSARSQVEVERNVRYFSESLDSAFKASRKRHPSMIFTVLSLIKVLRSPFQMIMNTFNPEFRDTDPLSLVNRTVTAKTFSGLADTDSMHSLLTNFFTASEIRNLELSRQGQAK
ncbi:MAG: hypothetical protein KGR26_01180 [Cyanobacteria bacterium REEB65]|nr:hypothetical protein [Cyanobacteria bacterium REEB65]